MKKNIKYFVIYVSAFCFFSYYLKAEEKTPKFYCSSETMKMVKEVRVANDDMISWNPYLMTL